MLRHVAPLAAACVLAACGTPEPSTAPAPSPPAAIPSAPSPAKTPAPNVQDDPTRPDTAAQPNLRFDPTAPDAPASDVTTTGTVQRVEVEGGGWVIVTPRGTFQPLDLDAAFQQNGLKVAVTLRPRPDMMSALMVGQIAEVVSIRRQ